MPATSFKIRGIQPPDLAGCPDEVKRMYWGWVVEFALRRKDKELSQGLDKEGKKLRPISARTRRYRRSAMTPTGKGDPSAPPLMPARHLSRTRSLLAGRALTTHADLYWRFDPFTGDTWGKILAIHARLGRDVIGLSQEGITWVQANAAKRWADWKSGKVVVQKAAMGKAPAIPMVGSVDFSKATFGIGAAGPPTGETTGGMTWEDWLKYLRSPAKVAIPGKSRRDFNVVLKHIWGEPGALGKAAGGAVVPKPPKPKPILQQRVAMAPRPKPARPQPPEPSPRPGNFRTVEHVRAWAKATFPDATFEHAGIPVENWNHIAAELDELARDYPEVAARLRQINPPGAIDWDKHPRWRAASDVDGGRILALNPDRWKKSWDELRSEQIGDAHSGWRPKGIYDPATAMTHEWGHLIDAWLKKSDPDRRKALYAILEPGGTFDRKSAGTLSQYAATDREEAFAEAFLASRWQARSQRGELARRFSEAFGQ